MFHINELYQTVIEMFYCLYSLRTYLSPEYSMMLSDIVYPSLGLVPSLYRPLCRARSNRLLARHPLLCRHDPRARIRPIRKVCLCQHDVECYCLQVDHVRCHVVVL